MLTLCLYHLLTFTNFILTLRAQYILGYSYLVFVGVQISCNVLYILNNAIIKVKYNSRKKLLLDLKKQRNQVLQQVKMSKLILAMKRRQLAQKQRRTTMLNPPTKTLT